jgi:hypothetical protein
MEYADPIDGVAILARKWLGRRCVSFIIAEGTPSLVDLQIVEAPAIPRLPVLGTASTTACRPQYFEDPIRRRVPERGWQV